jgi:hypothetical protein
MKELRKLIRLDVSDFLEISAVDAVKIIPCACVNITSMGICFSSQEEFKKYQNLFINYFIPDELDTVQLAVRVLWSEFVTPKHGYFCGGEILSIEDNKQDKFVGYYLQKLQERLSK